MGCEKKKIINEQNGMKVQITTHKNAIKDGAC